MIGMNGKISGTLTKVSQTQNNGLVGNLGLKVILGLHSRKVLKINVEVMFRVSVRSMTVDQMQSPDDQKRRQDFDEAIKMKLRKGMQYHEFKLDPDFAESVMPTRDC
jgi:hypothetical protein